MKTVRLFLVIIFLLIISGCKKENVLSNNDNCDVTNCLDVIDWNNSVSEINDIIGVEGTLIDATYNEYHWKISNDFSVYVDFTNKEIREEFNNASLINKKVDFTKYENIKRLVDDDSSITYEEVVEMLNNVDGVLIRKSVDSVDYIWVDDNSEYLQATFSQDSSKCIRLVSSF